MRNYLIAERYARGLSQSIANDADVEPMVRALHDLGALFETNHDFRSVLANPAIDRNKRQQVLDAVLEAEPMPRPVARLAQVLLRRGRITMLPDVAQVFAMLADARLNRVQATVTTALPLDQDRAGRLGGALERYSGKAVRMKYDVDPEILGGVVVRIGSTVVDGTVRTRLEGLRDALLAGEVEVTEEKETHEDPGN